MKQSLLKSSILRGLLSLFFLVAMVGNAWGEDETLTITGASSGNNAPWGTSYATGTGTSTTSASTSIGISYTNVGRMNTGIQIKANTSNCFYSTTCPTNKVITSIAMTKKTNNFNYQVSTDGSSWTTVETISATSTKNYNTSDGYKYFKISATSSYSVLTSVVVTYSDNAADTRTAVNMSTFTTAGGVTSIVKGNTLATSVTNDQSGWTAAYTYSSNNTNVATVAADGTISAVAKGTAKITASLNVSASDASYKAGTTTSKSIDITVTNPMHSVTWYVNGSEYTTGTPTTQVEEGNKVTVLPTAPTSTDATSTTFVGWSTSEVTTKTNTAPSVLFKDAASAPSVSGGNANYYAVFAKAEGTEEWEKVSASTSLTAGTYIMISSDGYAFNGTINSSGHGDKTETAFSFTNDKATSAPEGACRLTLAVPSSGHYTLFNSSNGYLYAKSNSSGNLAWHETESKYWMYSSSKWMYELGSNDAQLRYYNNAFKTYASSTTNGTVPAFAKLVSNINYSDYVSKIAAPLSAPTLNEVSGIHATSATITWSAVSNADGYQYKIGEGVWQTAGDLTQKLTGLTAGTEYTVSVRANGSGDYCDGPAASKTFTTLYTVTAASSNNEWGTAQVSLNNTDWANSVETTKGTTVYVKATPASAAYAHTGWQTTNGTIADGQLTGWTTSATVTAQFALAQRTGLDTPTGMSATAGVISTTVSWTAVEHASSYKLIFNGTAYEGLTTTSKEITGLTAGTTYKWTVQAIGDGVSYDNSAVCAEQSFTTTAKAIESIAIETAPTKTYYLKGDAFAKDGMVVKATYNNGDVETVAAENYTVSPATFTTTGEQNVTVSFTYNEVEKTTTQAVNVKEKWAVKFVVNGSENTLYEETPDAGITPPTTSKIGDYTFQFWSETNQTEETTTAPDKITLTNGKYVPTEAKTFYAVYAMNKDADVYGYILSVSNSGTTTYMCEATSVNSNTSGTNLKSTTTKASAQTFFYTEDGYLYYISNSKRYYAYPKGSGSTDVFTFAEGNKDDAHTSNPWTIVNNNDGTISFMIGDRYLALNSNVFRNYGTKTTTINHFSKETSSEKETQSVPYYLSTPSAEATPVVTFSTKAATISTVNAEGVKSTYKNETLSVGGSTGTVTYESSNETIASVATDGTVSVVKGGEVTITATVAAVSGTWKTASASYTLKINKVAPTISFDNNQPNQVYVANTITVHATSSSDGTVYYADNSDKLDIDEKTGIITGVGTTSGVNVYAYVDETDLYTAKNTTSTGAKMSIKVVSNTKTQTLSFAQTSFDFSNGQTVDNFTNTLTGAKTAVTYASDNTAIAEVNETTGEVTVHTNTGGKATITATAAANDNVVEDGIRYNYGQATKSFTIAVNYPKPTFSLAAGEYHSDQLLELSATGAEYIYYTTDGTTPTFDGTNGTGTEQDLSKGNAIIALEKGNTTVKAIAVYADNDLNFFAGAQASVTYTLVAPAVPTVSFEDNATVDLNSSIALSSAEGTTITYSVYDDDFLVEETTSTSNSAQFTASKGGVYTVEFKSTWAEKDGYSSNTVQYTLKVAGPAAIPFAYNGNATDMPTCFTTIGKFGDYNASSNPNTQIQMKTQDNALILWIAEEANTLSYSIKCNGDWNTGSTYVVSTSTDGESYNAVKTYTSTSGVPTDETLETLYIPTTARYIKWEYETKVSTGNIGLGNIKVTLEPTYTAQTLTMVANNTSGYWATFSNENVTFFPEMDNNIEYQTTVKKESLVDNKIVATDLSKGTASIGGEDIEGYFVPANTGVLIKVEFDKEEKTIPYYTVANRNVTALESNLLKPSSEAMIGDYKFYKLAYNDYAAKTGLGFYYGAANGTAFTCKAGTAYLAVPTGSSASEVRGFSFDDINGNETTLKAVETVNEENTIYNISGQRVNKVQKSGLYIVNGKTQLIKK